LKRTLILGGAAFALSACTGLLDYDKVAKMSSKGSVFQGYLQKEYVQLAESEYLETDLGDTEFFTSRARMAAMGQPFGPQNINDRKLPKGKVGALGAARARLMRVLEGRGAKVFPQPAARAQAMFDCWMQEQEENFQPADIARCRADFEKAMAAFKPKPMAKAKPAPKPMPMAKAKPMKLPGPFTVYFGHDSAKISGAAVSVIRDALMAIGRHKPKNVQVKGYTDRSGDGDYNLVLSLKRLDAVGEMMQLSLPSSRILQAAYGEDRPAMKTKDGVKEAKNRRVTISLKRK
jgi:OOP family OmpA-OmpF porin